MDTWGKVMVTDLEQITKTDSLKKAEEKFCHEYNPLHFYSRLRDMGFKEEDAKSIAMYYGEYVFTPVCETYHNFIEPREEDQ